MKKYKALISVISLLTIFSILSCSKKASEPKGQSDSKSHKWNRQDADREYRLLQTELKMAESKKLYLVIDLRRMELEFRLKGATVWTQPLELLDQDAEKMSNFARRFEGDDAQFIRPIANKYLFSADKKTPDSVLAIVGQAVGVDPNLLQRDVPSRFQLGWEGGLVLDIRTDIVGKPGAKLKNVLLQVGQAIKSPFGEINLEAKMNPEGALTLYRASNRGVPTILCPPLR